MPDTVLIAAQASIQLLTRGDLTDALAFPDSDVPAALDAIVRHRPRVVALDRAFAESPRGTALVHRIKVDPSLKDCAVRIVSETSDAAAAAGTPPVVVAVTSGAALDATGTRAAMRYQMRAEVTVTLDGNAATLVNLSVGGAQVLATSPLRPSQRVRLTVRSAAPPMRLGAAVMWANYEMPKEGARFRAGLAFTSPDVDVLTAFIDAYRVRTD